MGYVSGVRTRPPEASVEVWASGFDIAIRAPHWVWMFPVGSIREVKRGGRGRGADPLIVTIESGGLVRDLIFQDGNIPEAERMINDAVEVVKEAARRPIWKYQPLSLRMTITLTSVSLVLAGLESVT